MWTFLLLLLSCLLKIDKVPANSSSSKIVSTAQSSSLVSISTSSTELQPNVSSDNLTVTLDLNSSVFSNPPSHTFEPTPTSGLQTLPTVNGSSPTTTATPTIRCSDINWNNRFNACSDKECVQKQMKILDMMPSCLKESPDNVSFSRMDVPEKALSLGMAFANVIKTKLENGTETNSTVVVMTRDMAMEVGVIDMANYTGTNEESLSIPAKFTGKWADMGNYISMPLENLPLSASAESQRSKLEKDTNVPTVIHIHADDVNNFVQTRLGGEFSSICRHHAQCMTVGDLGKFVIYVVAIMPNVLGDKWMEKDEMDWEDDSVAQSVMSELYVVGDKLETRKKLPKKRINSNLLSVRIQHEGKELKGPLTKPALLSLAHLHTKDHFETTCVFLEEGLWSKDGCDVKETHGSQTKCRTKYLSTFALISKVTEKSDNSARQMVVTVATVMGSFSILGLLICAIVAIVINYHQWDSIRIALNIDVSLLLSQLIFFIGLPTDDNLFFSKPKTCEVVSPFVHLFELAALSWLLMEGLHYYSTLKPLFNEKNTVPIVFYFSVGWGLPVAFASACADFSYPHFGSPERSEFCWMFIRGNEAWFFGAPVLILVVLNLVVRAFILKEVITWQDDPDDIRLERAKDRLVTSLVMMLAIVLTWFFGILAVNNTEDKIFHYVFIVFYTLQGLLVFLFYCVRNKEMWEYRKQKKDEEEKEKNKTYEFVYHP